MNKALTLRIVLENPVPGVAYGIQMGKGSTYETILKQMSDSFDLVFELTVGVKFTEGHPLVFTGPLVQGTPKDRFIYIDIGTYAGQKNTVWGRRLKIPLTGIPLNTLTKMSAEQVLMTKVPGTGKDGGPHCATVKSFNGWEVSP